MIDEGFFRFQKCLNGTKGLIIIGDKLLVYRRDGNTDNHPYEIDIPGGGADGDESGFDTFARESREEFGLTVTKGDIVYAKKFQHNTVKGEHGYFCVARFDESKSSEIVFGDEGLEYYLMEKEVYLKHPEAWAMFQQRAQEYFNSTN